ncbi:amino acid/amide ABC transporter membrane protein 1, HAAT family [Schinkia azotoformans MEV2011]|uniref:Branched-chain amino acid ABC transporter permease n=2 Tax=Schinkia azotoformans TaxID=1454 RepID=K6D8E4_SCHAZ|nr:branched-chain amino acid ABC transporter permease [Schinkia azotoformans]EKN64544.1 branched-chain amino acid ABC transporter permease [Schinkia azotoformans LMG 9581]KEF39188.1 amino acid/amide ABC transporter membrane protein 1, HAAT family [Schinkia azotoformans MEV2011]MEC1637855.1 branched-chain amino acid ABC transporter permease [Schinkia azotoformans]MEC1695855.1 branched-chain amino acid ABC transporter permease [Schinkia azotoformans]MEC1726011.1 branched-chain amino acid ABC tra
MDILVNITINGLATGMLIFLLAAGLTLIFGLMDVLNFAHGALFLWGAYVGIWTYGETNNFVIGMIAAIISGALLGYLLERFIIKPVYGNHIQQILITLGAMLVMGELVKVVWGPNIIEAKVPPFLNGSWEFGDIIIIKYRIFIILVGFIVFGGLLFLLNKTKLGLIVRAGVMNKEMVQALGIDIRKIFLFVFILGAAMAGLAGILLGPYSGVIHAEIGLEYGILAFIVVIIGGMGSVLGSAMAAVLVGILGAYAAYFVPDLAVAVNMLIMLIILIFKPSGLLGSEEVVKQ